MITKQKNKSIKKPNELNVSPKECAILTLTPKSEILEPLKELSFDMLNLPEELVNTFSDISLLSTHTVPVCIPLLTHPDELSLFIKKHSELLFDIMLTAWPFPINTWGFSNKNLELLNKFVDIKYYPTVCKAIDRPFTNTLDLSVTFATPTKEFANYLIDRIGSKKMTLTDEELIRIDFLTNTGIALITNTIEKKKHQTMLDFLLAINDSKNYLTGLGDKKLETLFYFYFNNPADFPEEKNDKFLEKWFETKTYAGMYLFPE